MSGATDPRFYPKSNGYTFTNSVTYEPCPHGYFFPHPVPDGKCYPYVRTNGYVVPDTDSYPIADTAPHSAAERY